MAALTAWSYSRWATHSKCPRKFKYQFLDKLKEKPSAALERGDAVHKEAARFVTGVIRELPESLKNFERQMFELSALDGKIVEQQWGYDRNWAPTGWFGADTWLRVVLDAVILYEDDTADLIDFKTGKRYDTNMDQVELFALSVFMRFPRIQRVTARLWYLDLKPGENEFLYEFDRSQVAGLIARWEKEVGPMFADRIYPARPSRDNCRFCSWKRSEGGPCEFDG